MNKVTAYKCDYCSITSINAGALSQHERKCKHNPNNKHKCFNFCTHLKRELMVYPEVGNVWEFTCLMTGDKMYSYKAEHRNDFMKRLIKNNNLTRMPSECDKHEPMGIDEY